jgi:flagellar protein FlgJ
MTGAVSGINLSNLSDIAFQASINASAPAEKTLQQAAQSFESLYVQMLLKSMRGVNKTLKSEFTANQENDTYQDLLDQQLSIALSATQSLGIAKLMTKQLGGSS